MIEENPVDRVKLPRPEKLDSSDQDGQRATRFPKHDGSIANSSSTWDNHQQQQQRHHTTDSNRGGRIDPISSSHHIVYQGIDDAVQSAVQASQSNDVNPELVSHVTQRVLRELQAQNSLDGSSLSNLSQHRTEDTRKQRGEPQWESTSVEADIYERQQDRVSMRSENNLRSKVPPGTDTRDYANDISIPVLDTRQPDTADTMLSDGERRRSLRPDPPRRMPTDGDLTTLEKCWGILFDNDKPTTRLEQLLRGIAVHLIEEYEPRHSLVVTADKLQKYYSECAVRDLDEIYPWQWVFDDKTSSISKLLRESDIQVEHHLVQRETDTRPDLPGMTPQGFAKWVGLLIQAHPDIEYVRLSDTLTNMAISNPDDRKERFPKELLRRQLPAEGNEIVAALLKKHVENHCKVELRPRNPSVISMDEGGSQYSPSKMEFPPAPTVQEVTDESELPDHFSNINTQRMRRPSLSTNESISPRLQNSANSSSFSTNDSNNDAVVPDTSDLPTPIPLERERKPYVAQEGQGKQHNIAVPFTQTQERMARMTTQEPDNSYVLKSSKTVSSRDKLDSVTVPTHQQNDEGIHELSRSQTTDPNVLQHTRRNTIDEGGTRSSRRRSNTGYVQQPPSRYRSARSPSLDKESRTRGDLRYNDRPHYPPLQPSNSNSSSNYTDRIDYNKGNYDSRESRDNRDRSNRYTLDRREREPDRLERDRDRDRDRGRDNYRDKEYDQPRPQSQQSRPRPRSIIADASRLTRLEDDEQQQQYRDRDRERDYRSPRDSTFSSSGFNLQTAPYPPSSYRDRDRELDERDRDRLRDKDRDRDRDRR